MEEFWKNCLSRLRAEFPSRHFQAIVSNSRLRETADGTFQLVTPSEAGARWLRKNVVSVVKDQLREARGTDTEVDVVTESVSSPSSAQETAAPAAAPEQPSAAPRRSVGLRDDMTFDSFVAGNSNEFARIAALGVAVEGGGEGRSPLFICGNVGVGKTHLAQAAGNHFLKEKPNRTVRYLQARDFTSEMVIAYREGTIESFKDRFRKLDMLIVDDIQYISGERERSQEEFFYLFNHFINTNKPIVVTSDALPKQIKNMQQRVISRFTAGLIVAIDPPEIELRIAILQNKASQRGKKLDDSIARYMAERIKSNVRELEGALNQVIAYATHRNVEIDVDLCRQALANRVGARASAPTVETIQQKVSAYFSVRLPDLKSSRRTRALSHPRHIAIYLTRNLTEMSLPEIGQQFGGRNHTTVLHACRTIDRRRREDEQTEQDIRMLTNLLSG